MELKTGAAKVRSIEDIDVAPVLETLTALGPGVLSGSELQMIRVSAVEVAQVVGMVPHEGIKTLGVHPTGPKLVPNAVKENDDPSEGAPKAGATKVMSGAA